MPQGHRGLQGRCSPEGKDAREEGGFPAEALAKFQWRFGGKDCDWRALSEHPEMDPRHNAARKI